MDQTEQLGAWFKLNIAPVFSLLLLCNSLNFQMFLVSLSIVYTFNIKMN